MNNNSIFTMSDDIIQLNKFLKAKTLLFKDVKSNKNDSVFVNLLIKLVNEKYQFSPQQVDKFMVGALYSQYGYYCFMESTNDNHKCIIKYILENNDIDKEYVKHIISLSFHNGKYCIDILFKKKYNFDLDDFKTITHRHPYYKYCGDDYDVFHNNLLYIECNEFISETCPYLFGKSIALIKNEVSLDITPFEIILNNIVANGVITHKKCDNNSIKLIRLRTIINELLQKINEDDIIECIINKRMILDNFTIMIVDQVFKKVGHNKKFYEYMFKYVIPIVPEHILQLMVMGYKFTSTKDINFFVQCIKRTSTLQIQHNNDYESIGLSYTFLEKYEMINNFANIPILDIFPLCGFLPDVDTLNILCANGDINDDIIQKLLNEYDVTPNNETATICALSLDCDITEKILKYKVVPDVDVIYKWKELHGNRRPCIGKMLELLVRYGFIININHIKYLLSLRICINNLERFDIKYDEELYFICYLNDYFPETYLPKFTIDKNVLQLHNLCKEPKLQTYQIRKLMETSGIKLDRYALDILISQNYYVCCDIISQYNILPSMLTTYKQCKLPLSLEVVAKQYGISSKDMLEQYDMIIKHT